MTSADNMRQEREFASALQSAEKQLRLTGRTDLLLALDRIAELRDESERTAAYTDLHTLLAAFAGTAS